MPTIYNKIELNGTTLLDLSQDTASSASHIRSGYIAHLNDGTQVTGTYSGGIPTLQSKTYNVSSAGTATVTADNGYDGLSSVAISTPSAVIRVGLADDGYETVSGVRKWKAQPYAYAESAGFMNADTPVSDTLMYNAVPANTVITPSSTAQTIGGVNYMMEGAVTVSAMSTMTLPTSAASSATSGYTSKATIGRSTAAQYINIPPGYNSAGAYYVISAVANGSATAPASISGTAASVSTGTNTLTLTKTVSVTPTVSAGYVSSGTAGNSSVSLTASVTTKAAATITPTTTNQTIAAGTYLTGIQTIAGDADLVGSNILSTANIFGVQGTVVVQNYYTGSSAPSSSLGSNGDLYLQA